jgi:hypothetical protein
MKKPLLPYNLLRLGPSEKPCPLHSNDEGLLLEFDHPYWSEFEKQKGRNKHCKCWIQRITGRRREEYLKTGVPSHGDPVLDEKGRPTGHIHLKYIPAITKK